MWTAVGSPFGRWSRWFAGLAFAGLVLTSCSADPTSTTRVPDPADPYAVEYEQAMQGASEFVKQVLADHHISDAELAEAQDHVVACLREQGQEPLITTENGWREVHVPTEAGFRCSDEWLGTIQQDYRTERMNPRNENMNELIVACLKRLDLVPPEFTSQDLSELDQKTVTTEVWAVDDDGNETKIEEKLPEDPDPKLPSGMSLYGPETEGCRNNPLDTGFG